ncbi:MAG: hypothetical protein ACFCVC_19680 [Acidimicrobiia bacterium]
MSRFVVVGVACAALMAVPGAAWAAPLEPYLDRAGEAEFSGQQVVTCETPTGSRTIAIGLNQIDGTTTARSAADGSTEVQMAGGTFSVVSDDGTVDTSAAVTEAIPEGLYTVSKVEMVTALGRPAQRVTIVDGAGLIRATVTFDAETGAMLVSRIRNADGSIYCDSRMVEFSESARQVSSRTEGSSQDNLESADLPDGLELPEQVAGFSRIETFTWERGGVVAYYSDGLFSFTLLATMRPVVLDSETADAVTIEGGEYVRWFGAGQSIYVWDTEAGGLAMYGDLPLDLQEAVLAELPDPARIGVLARWWRNLFG